MLSTSGPRPASIPWTALPNGFREKEAVWFAIKQIPILCVKFPDALLALLAPLSCLSACTAVPQRSVTIESEVRLFRKDKSILLQNSL